MMQRFIRWWHRDRIKAAREADPVALRSAIEKLTSLRGRILILDQIGHVTIGQHDSRRSTRDVWETLYHAELHLVPQLEDALRYRNKGAWSL